MKISVITPSFNQGSFIERTIQSVLQQNIQNLEYFVMDGGSQDETISILEKYADRLTYISEPDDGQAHAVNKGLSCASGDIIAWINSDDIYYTDTLKKVIDYFEMHADIDVVYGKALHIDQHDKVIEPYPTEIWNINRLKQTCYLSQPAVFFRRKLITQYGMLDKSLSFCMDYEYWLRLALKGVRFAYLPELLAGSRLHPQTKTMSSPLKATEEALRMLKMHNEFVPLRWLINFAVCSVKHSSSWRFPAPRFVMATYCIALRKAFQLNGFFRGVGACFMLPFVMATRSHSR
jgi:glycosyltransferase involved in cell wall biosynthesis